jgi:hypothetical protein
LSSVLATLGRSTASFPSFFIPVLLRVVRAWFDAAPARSYNRGRRTMTTTTITEVSSNDGAGDDGRYPFQAIERKWQARWDAAGVYKTGGADDPRPKYYVLDMFPYPSGSGLHVGHCRNYVPGDVVARLKHMQGFNVLHPMGWDAFGQPAEQDAIKRGVNPSTVVPLLAKEYKRQLSILGNGYDWDREINSTDPDYYKWNQWAFLLFRERGWRIAKSRRSTGAKTRPRFLPTRRSRTASAGAAAAGRARENCPPMVIKYHCLREQTA